MKKHCQKFSLGQVWYEDKLLRVVPGSELVSLLERHAQGDWGNISIVCRLLNEIAVRWGFGLVSVYQTTTAFDVVIETERDRSETFVILTPRR